MIDTSANRISTGFEAATHQSLHDTGRPRRQWTGLSAHTALAVTSRAGVRPAGWLIGERGLKFPTVAEG